MHLMTGFTLRKLYIFNILLIFLALSGCLGGGSGSSDSTTATPKASKLVLLVNNNNQPADGKSTISLTVIARDSTNGVVANVPITLVSQSSTALFAAMSGTTDAQGVFSTTVTSQVQETFTVTAQSDSIRSETVSLSFGSEQTTDSRVKSINVVVENDGQSADGSSTITLTTVPRDQNNQPIAGITVNLFSPSDEVIFDKITGNTDEKGRFTVTATSHTPGTYQVIVRAGGAEAAPVNITFAPHLARASWLTLESSETVLAVQDKSTVTVKLYSGTILYIDSNRDIISANNLKLLPQAAFKATVTGNAVLHDVPELSDNNGAATFTVSDDKAETVTLTVTSAFATKSISLYFGARLELLPKTQNTIRQTILTALLKDGTQAPIPDQAVRFGFAEKNSETLSAPEVNTNTQGLAQVTVTDLENDGGTATVIAARGTLRAQATVNFKAAFGQNRQLTATTNSPVLATTDRATITAIITDNNGLPIQGQVVKFRSTGKAQFSVVSGTSDAEGKVQTVVSDSIAEDIVVTVEADTAQQTIPLYFGAKVQLSPQFVEDGVVNGETPVTLTASILNGQGQGIAGIPLNLRISSGRGLLSKYHDDSDAQGRVSFNITDSFEETVTVEAQTGVLNPATAQVKFTLPAAPIATISLTTPTTIINLNQEVSVTAEVLDSRGHPVANTLVNFSAEGAGTINSSALTDQNGVATVKFRSTTQAGIATVKATVGTVQTTLALLVNPSQAGVIELKSIEPQRIGVIGSGVTQSATLTFLVKDNLGNLVADGTVVNFSLGTTTLGGGETISSTRETTHNGIVSTTLKSGSVAGNIDVIASLAETQVSTLARVTIVSSTPDARHLSLAAEFLNIVGAIRFGITDQITAYVGDRFGNIVPDGTGISFISEGGTIGKSIGGGAFTTTTEMGQATAILQSAEPTTPNLTGCSVPYPSSLKISGCGNPGLNTIVAYTTGSESFTDSNGNGRYDSGEPFEDLSEPYIDANDNGQFDSTELYVDVNGDGFFNSKNSQFDSNTTIWTSMKILFSGHIGTIQVTPETFKLSNGEGQSFTVTLSDTYGNALVAGTTFTVTSDADVTTSITDITGKTTVTSSSPLGGTTTATLADSHGSGQTLVFTLTNRGYTPQTVNIRIQVTAPTGTTEGQTETLERTLSGTFN